MVLACFAACFRPGKVMTVQCRALGVARQSHGARGGVPAAVKQRKRGQRGKVNTSHKNGLINNYFYNRYCLGDCLAGKLTVALMCRLLLCSAAAVFDCLTPQLGSSAAGSKAGWVLEEDSETVPDDVLLALVAYLTPQEVAVSAHVSVPSRCSSTSSFCADCADMSVAVCKHVLTPVR